MRLTYFQFSLGTALPSMIMMMMMIIIIIIAVDICPTTRRPLWSSAAQVARLSVCVRLFYQKSIYLSIYLSVV